MKYFNVRQFSHWCIGLRNKFRHEGPVQLTLALAQFLQTVKDDSGTETETYQRDWPLALTQTDTVLCQLNHTSWNSYTVCTNIIPSVVIIYI